MVKTSEEHQSGRVKRWGSFLQAFDVTVEYIKGAANVVADALSRDLFTRDAESESDSDEQKCGQSDDTDNVCGEEVPPFACGGGTNTADIGALLQDQTARTRLGGKVGVATRTAQRLKAAFKSMRRGAKGRGDLANKLWSESYGCAEAELPPTQPAAPVMVVEPETMAQEWEAMCGCVDSLESPRSKIPVCSMTGEEFMGKGVRKWTPAEDKSSTPGDGEPAVEGQGLEESFKRVWEYWDEMRVAQLRDKECAVWMEKLKQGEKVKVRDGELKLDGEVLKLVDKEKQVRLVLPASKREEVLRSVHENIRDGGHYSARKGGLKLKRRF
jgi:hypothetical protein